MFRRLVNELTLLLTYEATKDVALETKYPSCTGATVPADINARVFVQVLCDSQVSLFGGTPFCPAGSSYPRLTAVNDGLHPLPPAARLPSMPNPCGGVPANPWCPAATRSGALRPT